MLQKRPIAAWQDRDFATQARDLPSPVFVAHVRYASTGGLSVVNTQPFAQDGWLFAHNGASTGLDQLDRRIAGMGAFGLVQPDTDSERMFALVTAEIGAHDGHVEAGLIAAVKWIATTIPVYSLNLILATPQQLWALRYPETNELWVLQRDGIGRGALDANSSRIRTRSAPLAGRSSTIVASEPMDDDPGWRLLSPGELIRIDDDHKFTCNHPFPPWLTYPLSVADLSSVAARSQANDTA